MGAIVAATLAAAGSAVVAALQARTLRREAEVLHEQWEVETSLSWLRVRRDAAHATTPAPAGLFRRAFARQTVATPIDFDPATIDDESDTVLEEDFDEEELVVEQGRGREQKATKVSVESLSFAPFLLDASAGTAWLALLGVLTVVSLLGPQVSPDLAQVSALLIPLATLALAGFYPIPWAWAMVVVAWLQGMSAWGYSLAGGSFQSGDAGFCVAMYLLNAAAVSILAARTMQRHRQWIVMRGE
jgi:hypothetical protein